ncbi:MAG: hypothetical protein LBI30_00800 [Holosporales bacterium]|jgi:surface antigen|nr:hypothetical protein [Holosporales bacterium]
MNNRAISIWIAILFVAPLLSGCSVRQSTEAFDRRYLRQETISFVDLNSAIEVLPEDKQWVTNLLYKALETGRVGQKFECASKRTCGRWIVIPAKIYFNRDGQIARSFTYVTGTCKTKAKKLTAVRNSLGKWIVFTDKIYAQFRQKCKK